LEYTNDPQVISLSDIFISPLEDMYVYAAPLPEAFSYTKYSYFVTELLGTDLHRLLTSRPLEKQFIQYFLYQILVSMLGFTGIPGSANTFVAGSEICPLCRCRSPRSQAQQHPRQRKL
jgi:hypothetical protein